MPILQWRDKSKRALNTIITTAFLATQLLVPIGLSSHASADNNGTLKVHEFGTPVGTESNATHVCAFNFEGYGFDAGQTGLIKIEPQSPSADTTGSATLSFGPSNANGFYSTAYINVGTQTLANGHYKSTLYGRDTAGNYTVDLKAKSKVFWVDCITPVQPTLDTQVSSQNVKSGDTVYDTATLTGDSDHGDVTGSVAFSLCGPALTAPDCTTGGTAVGSAVEVTKGQAVSAGIPITTNTALGMYCVRADYTPTGSAYLSASHTNKTTECFMVTSTPQPPTPAQPTVDVSTTPCTANTNTSDTLNATVTNTADNTHAAVTYTVTVKNGSVVVATQTLANLADGASSGQLHFSNLPAGTYTVTVAGNDGTSATSSLITVNACPFVPATPTAVASLMPCTVFSGLNDTVTVLVTNTADGTHQTVTYTVSFAGQTQNITLADGDHGTVTFNSLNTGNYSATVTANDGTGPITTNQVRVGSCPRPVPTAQVRVIKRLVPSNDSGRFDLSIGGVVKATAVGDDGTTGFITVPTSTHSVSESAGNESTNLSNYSSSYRCYNDENDGNHENGLSLFTANQNVESQSGSGTSFSGLVLHSGDKVTCVFTNTLILKPAIEVVKHGPATAYEGDKVTYTFAVTNTGNTPLYFTQVNDNVVGYGVYVSGDTNHNHRLDVGETWLYSKSYVIPAHSNDITNTVTACAWGAHEQEVCDTDHHTTHIYHPYIKVTKHVVSNFGSDNGVFNLNIDGTTKATGGNNATTGNVLVTPGTHYVSETGANGTVLSDYDSQIRCWVGETYVGVPNDTTLHNVTVTGDQHAYCVITNTRHAAHLTVVKDAVPNDPQPFSFTLAKQNDCDQVSSYTFTRVSELGDDCNRYTNVGTPFQLVDNTDPTLASKVETLSPGKYKVTEGATAGWDLTGLTCTGADVTVDGSSVYVTLTSGANVTCTYTNTKRANVTIVKDAQPDTNQLFNFTTSLGNSFSLMDDGSNSGAKSTQFTNVVPGTYTVTEAATGGWKLASAECGVGVTTSLSNGTLTITVAPGANLTCTFTNTRIVGDVLGVFTTATGGMGGGNLPTVAPATIAVRPAPVELANTGQSVWANVIAGLAIAGAALGLGLATRKQQTN